MASDKGPIAAEAPPPSANTATSPSALLQSLASDAVATDAARSKSLKRHRESSPTSPTTAASFAAAAAAVAAERELSPSKVARLAGLPSKYHTAPLTGAAAREDERRQRDDQQRETPGTSENPSHQALSSLMSGGALAMSRPQDAPPNMNEASDLAARALAPVSIPPPNASATAADTKAEVSPQSVTSAASLGGAPVTSSPAPMDVDPREERPGYAPQPEAQMEEKGNSAMSYPGLHSGVGMSAPPARGMSLPMPGQGGDGGPRSPSSSKKHKCPYCDTEFTRHHNLKSHLLTHSQEKPYVCQTCQLRFRRLHDLKRHTKLHTGEKPHICNKCHRKFARGDALARHSKGAGGCAGRRASMGSFGGDDEYEGASTTDADDSAMAGVLYESTHEGMSEEDRRHLSLPTIKAQHVPGSQADADVYPAHSRTYPPVGTRPSQNGGLYPPNVERAAGANSTASSSVPNSSASGHTPNTSISSMPMSAGSGSMYAQGGMTESPKPLSPGQETGNANRQRSPSLTAQFQQQHFGRRQSDRKTPPGLSLPSPHGTTHAPKLPAISGFAAPDGRLPQSSTASAAAAATTTHGGITNPPTGAQSRNSSGHQGSGDSSNLFASGEQGLWAYIQTLEEKVRSLSDKVTTMEKAETSREAQIGYLTNEVANLRKQLEARQDMPANKS